jgi:hypothetical protein
MTEIHGFKLIEERDLPDINSHARLFKHIKTGAELLSLENDDENKAFTVVFKTPPPDDTGIPHIMEHSVLAGSQKYQVKEPFLELLKTSVKTFLNAFTANDMTVYPVASTNLQDFYNLVDVYLDAVFFPLILPETMMQEGWHYENNGEDGTLSFKGVVFNEMKAAYSVPERVLRLVADRTLYPDTAYRNSAGGVPAAIPNLTYEQFKEFHKTYYHPSNARFVISGDDNPEERLRIVNEVISQFDAKEIDSELPLQTKFTSPVKIVEGYDFGENGGDKNQTMIEVSWLLPEITDQQTMMELSILSYALVSTSASPLRKALIDSGLGEGLVGGGLDDNARQATFRIGLKGIAEENAQAVETLILETLGNLAEDGIEKDTIRAALNTFEFSLRERNYGSFPRGLVNAMAAISPWIHGSNPMDVLSFGKYLDTVKQHFEEDDDYFERMIGQYLLDNSHRVTVVLNPDPEVGPKRDKAERDRLDETKANLSDEDLKVIIETQADLERRQSTPDDPEELAKIPTLTLNDIEREIKTVEQEIIEQDGARIYFHNQPTGGIIYFNLGLDLRTLPAELLPYVELLGTALTKMGTETEDFVKLTQRIGMKTGGIGASVNTTMKYDSTDFLAYLMVSGKVMADQSQEMLDIIKDILLTVKLDNQERFKQILLERKVGMERYLAMAGQAVAAKRVHSYFNLSDWAIEQMSGTDNLFFTRELVDKVENDWNSVLHALETVRTTLVNRSGMIVNVTMEGDKWHNYKTQLDSFLNTVPHQDAEQQIWQLSDGAAYEGLSLPAQSYFNGKAANIYQHGYQLHGSVSVITKLLSRDYMWQNVRVMGGAYGGMVGFSPSSGLVSYLSWRDPNIVKTLEVFDGASNYLKSLTMSDDDLEKTIIGAIGDLDGYDLPDAKGYKALMRHLTGYTDEMRQQYRDEVLATKLEHFHQFGEILAKIGDDARVAVVASPDALKAANEKLAGKFKMIKLQ